MLFIPHRSVARISSCLFSTIFQSIAQAPNPSIFLICSLLCPSLPKGCVSTLLRNKQAQGQWEWEVGSTFQAAPPLWIYKCHQPLPSVQPGQRMCPASRPAAQEKPDRIRSRMFNLISFPFLFQGAKQGGRAGTPGAVQPVHTHSAR